MTYKILRALCVFFLLPVFVLAGCGDKPETKDVSADFSSDFTAWYKKMEIKGHLCSNRQKMLNISIDSPKSLCGLEVSYKSSELHLTRDDMICSADEAYIPECSFPNILKSILSAVSEGRAVFKSSDKQKNTYDLNTGFGNAVLITDNSGRLFEAELADKEFKIEFVNLKLNNG